MKHGRNNYFLGRAFYFKINNKRLAYVIQMLYICREQLKIKIMKATFETQNLVNYKGEVLVNNDGYTKTYTSVKIAKKTADKVGGRVVKNVKRFIIVR